jgi:hypothetical protein
MKCVKTQEERNNGERSEATDIRRAELCMVDTLSSLLFCADILPASGWAYADSAPAPSRKRARLLEQ